MGFNSGFKVLNYTSPGLLPAAEPLSWWCEEINWSVHRGERKLAFRLKDSFRYQLYLFSVHDPNYTNVCFRISMKLKALLVHFQLSRVCVCERLTDVHGNLLQITSM